MWERTQDFYRRFAELEARGVSDVYFAWADGVAGDESASRLISSLPGMKQQPNLVFAAARYLGAPLGGYSDFREWLLENWSAVESVVLVRATQTNEAGRCAVLLPVLSKIDGPLALIEAGASAGLCLYPDRYSYRYDVGGSDVALDPVEGVSRAVLRCRIDEASVPTRLPEVVWRAGADLNPIDPADADSRVWLDTLVWPEHHERRTRLAAAIDIAAANPPLLVRGDLLDTIPELVASAPRDARVVVFHSAVLNYLDAGHREAFCELMRSHPEVTWISNEGDRVLPRVQQQLAEPAEGRMVLAVAERPVALTGPHGQSYQAV